MANLLIHFCGTGEDTAQHYKKFMGQLDADYMILFSGLGAKIQTDMEVGRVKDYYVGKHKKIGENDTDLTFETASLQCTEAGKFKNVADEDAKEGATKWYKMVDEESGKTIFLIEKKSKKIVAQPGGYKDGGMASRKAGKYTIELILTHLSDIKFDNITLVGHSRGAAIALPSFLYALYNTARGNKPFGDMASGIRKFLTGKENDYEDSQFKRMNLIFLDPVAGQSGNQYWMGQDWTTEDLYKKYFNWIGGKLHVTEVFARSAQMAPWAVAIGFKDFNPSRRFLYDHKSYGQKAYINYQRYMLGFRHSAMMRGYTGEGRDKNPYYENYELGAGPSWVLIKYMNQLITGDYHDISAKTADEWHQEFERTDEAAIRRIAVKMKNGTEEEKYLKDFDTIKQHYEHRNKKHKNHSGKEVSLLGLLGEARGGLKITNLINEIAAGIVTYKPVADSE